MVVPLGPKSKRYFQRALEAGRDAAHATHALKRSNFQRAEQRRLRLAASYERSERLSRLPEHNGLHRWKVMNNCELSHWGCRQCRAARRTFQHPKSKKRMMLSRVG